MRRVREGLNDGTIERKDDGEMERWRDGVSCPEIVLHNKEKNFFYTRIK